MPDLFTQEEEIKFVSTEQANLGDNFLSLDLKAKELSSQVKWVITQRKSEYVAELLKLRSHKSVSIRRTIADGLGSIASKDILYEVKLWQEKEDDRQTWLTLAALIDRLERGINTAQQDTSANVLSVTEAVTVVKKILGEGTYIIEGELTEVRPVREFYYFGLKDSQDSRIDCFLLGMIASRAGFPLNEGLSVRVEGKFKLGKNSRLIFDIKSMKLTGEGELLRNLKLLQEKLTQEGLFDISRKRKIPAIPQKVLLIASPNSAAVTDFTKVLGGRRTGIEIYFLPIKTQGIGSEFDIIQKMEIANRILDKYQIDTVVLTRGGGSSDDLFVFNSEKVVRALHALKRPTIVAIGHERDTTLAELAADLRASTPSNAAELVSLSSESIQSIYSSSLNYILSWQRDKIRQYGRVNQQLSSLIYLKLTTQINEARELCVSSDKKFSSLLYDLRTVLQNCVNRIQALVTREIGEAKNVGNFVSYSAVDLAGRMVRAKDVMINSLNVIHNLQYQMILQTQTKVSQLDSAIRVRDCKLILAQGYAIVKQNGKIIEKISQVDKSSMISLQMQDGDLEVNK
jgi:exodeoxyribonuclease VII large subunit